MQISELSELLGALLFGGNAMVAGLMLTGLITLLFFGLMSLANPPPAAYVFVAFMAILIAMGLGWLDYWLAVLISLVAAGAIAMRLADIFGG